MNRMSNKHDHFPINYHTSSEQIYYNYSIQQPYQSKIVVSSQRGSYQSCLWYSDTNIIRMDININIKVLNNKYLWTTFELFMTYFQVNLGYLGHVRICIKILIIIYIFQKYVIFPEYVSKPLQLGNVFYVSFGIFTPITFCLNMLITLMRAEMI